MAVLLAMRRRASLANAGSAPVERPRDTVRPLWRAQDGVAGGLTSPTGFKAGCPAQPHRRLMCGRKLVASPRLSQNTMPGVRCSRYAY
jgi:hypothetical protein